MGKQFDRVSIAIDQNGVEYIVLEPQVVIDYGQGQGPQGGVVTIKDGWIAVLGSGEARLAAGYGSPGGDIPPQLILRDPQGKRAVPRRGRLNLPLPVHWLAPMDVLLHSVRGRRRMLGESSVYVLYRPDQA